MTSDEENAYHPKDAIGLAVESTLVLGAAGLTVSAIQNTLTKRNVSGWGVFTRTGGVIAIFGRTQAGVKSPFMADQKEQPPLEERMDLQKLQRQISEKKMTAGTLP